MIKVEIIKIETSYRPNVHAHVSVALSGEGFKIIINDIRILQNRQTKQFWVAMPSHSWQRDTGDVSFVSTVELNTLLNAEVGLSVLAAFETWVAEGKR